MRSLGMSMLAGLAPFIAAATVIGCATDLPTGARPVPTTAVDFEIVAGDESIPPTCHGYTATIWPGMPADLVPRGAILRPIEPGRGEDGEIIEGHDESGAEDGELAGYYIVGTSGPDVIVGSTGRDSIITGNGDDVICGDPPQHEGDPMEGGDEGSCGGGMEEGSGGHGGGGPDHIWSGNGDDRVYGGGGPDTIFTSNGDDEIVGGGGPDVLYGEAGNDVIIGGPGPDQLFGGPGDDTLYGDKSNDWLAGSLGNDALFGGIGFDTVLDSLGVDLVDLGDQHTDDDGCGGEGG